jgi:hypothetical protein
VITDHLIKPLKDVFLFPSVIKYGKINVDPIDLQGSIIMVTDDAKTKTFESLWLCFKTEQMSAAQLDGHCKDDPEFKAYVDSKRS